MWGGKCRLWSVVFTVRSGDCKEWSEECKMCLEWSVECRVWGGKWKG